MAALRSTSLDDCPHEYKGPISLEIMVDPVITITGHTYEREVILAHFSAGWTTDPLTRTELGRDPVLIPNVALRKLIQTWVQEDRGGVRAAEFASLRQLKRDYDAMLAKLDSTTEALEAAQLEHAEALSRADSLQQEVEDLRDRSESESKALREGNALLRDRLQGMLAWSRQSWGKQETALHRADSLQEENENLKKMVDLVRSDSDSGGRAGGNKAGSLKEENKFLRERVKTTESLLFNALKRADRLQDRVDALQEARTKGGGGGGGHRRDGSRGGRNGGRGRRGGGGGKRGGGSRGGRGGGRGGRGGGRGGRGGGRGGGGGKRAAGDGSHGGNRISGGAGEKAASAGGRGGGGGRSANGSKAGAGSEAATGAAASSWRRAKPQNQSFASASAPAAAAKGAATPRMKCWYFANGGCQFGDKCKNVHTL